jgi:ribosome biogenesis GTPase A
MTINWFPGHMNKARRELAEALRRIDVVIELVDARLPRSSRNPMLEELRGETPCLTLLNKSDLADPATSRAWLEALDRVGDRAAIEISADRPASVRGVPGRCRKLAPHRRGPGKTLRCIVVGIPNVGKSTLINTLLGRHIARVADRPAVTQHQQRFHLDSGISLADTPGVLWPKLADQQGAYRLAASGAIRETAFDVMDVAVFAVGFLAARYAEPLRKRYKLDLLASEPLDLLESIGRKRGFLRRGGVVDVERAAETLLRELRAGELGRVSFERPEDFCDLQS